MLGFNKSDEEMIIEQEGSPSCVSASSLSASSPEPLLDDPTSAVFEGGGAKGAVYCGGIKVLAKIGALDTIKSVGGASVGAITALIMATGWEPEEIANIVSTTNFAKLIEGGFLEKIKIPYNVIFNYGLFTGMGIYHWLGDIVERATTVKAINGEVIEEGNRDMTFEQWHALKKKYPELKLKDIYVKATNANSRTVETFSYKSEHKDVPIRDAVRGSMAFPVVFTPWLIKGCFYKDGGMQDNCPVSLFEKNGKYNPEIVVFRADSEAEIQNFENGVPFPPKPINNFIESFIAGIEALLNVQNIAFYASRYKKRNTVFCSTLNVGTLDFRLSNDAINALIASGEYATIMHFIKKHDKDLNEFYSEKFITKMREADAPTIEDFLKYKKANPSFIADGSPMVDVSPERDNLENPRKEWKKIPYFESIIKAEKERRKAAASEIDGPALDVEVSPSSRMSRGIF